MSEVSDTLFDMLSLEQKTFLSMKCTLYQGNWERLCSYMDNVKDDAVLQYRDKDKARAALYMTKVQLSALRVHDITNQDRVVITRVLYSNSKMYHILYDYIDAFPFVKMYSDSAEVYFDFTSIKQAFPDILDYKEMLRYRVLSASYKCIEQLFSPLSGTNLIVFLNGYLCKLLLHYVYGTATSIDIPYNTLMQFFSSEEVLLLLLSDRLKAAEIFEVVDIRRISPAVKETYLHLDINTSRSIYRGTLSSSGGINLIVYIKENKLLQEEILIDELSTGDLI